MPTRCGHYLADSGGNNLRGPVMMVSRKNVWCGKQSVGLASGLLVVKRLIMRQSSRSIKNVDHSRHIFVHQTNQFEVSRGSKENAEALTGHEWRAGYTG